LNITITKTHILTSKVNDT